MLAALLLAIVPPLSSYDPIFSSCIPSSADPQHVCDFLIEVTPEGGKYALVLSEKVGMEGKHAKWSRTDILIHPHPKSNTSYFVGGNGALCEYNGRRDEQVIAIAADNGDKQWLTAISYAWKVDVKTKKLIAVSPKNLRCENEGWGI